MADTINVQDANDWLGQVESRAHELVDLLKAGVDISTSGNLGDIALFDTLSAAPVGTASILRNKIDFDVSVRSILDAAGLGGQDQPEYPPASMNDDPVSIPAGIYRVTSQTGDRPYNGRGGTILFTRYDTESVTVLYFPANMNEIYYRYYYNDEWSAWHKFYNTSQETGWITPTLLDGWTTYGSSYDSVQYRRDAMGYVHLKGLLRTFTDWHLSDIFTLPAGFRPAGSQIFGAFCDQGASSVNIGRINVYPSGTVGPGPGAWREDPTNVGWVSLAGISFVAEI
ncbi:pyocin knob domain-containing protein [Salinicola sp. CPA57]|uniref:pyocin knob domain-containing protein n=1 Tax=Salinicola sp. CPA57 TaxID=1949080 RepID=UPI0013007C42|nr:pyocin knob domain-containing protein [Salinicola sp. CPA57]